MLCRRVFTSVLVFARLATCTFSFTQSAAAKPFLHVVLRGPCGTRPDFQNWDVEGVSEMWAETHKRTASRIEVALDDARAAAFY